jgi:hypothetical protein
MRRLLSALGFASGLAIAAAGLLGLGEVYLRQFPPAAFQLYLGEDSPQAGIYAPDPAFAARPRSWAAFHADNADRLAAYLPFDQPGQPVWAFFGNSFVQAPGMLGDQARARVTDRTIFYLGRNEPVFVRFAQVDFLLEHGLGPERVVFALLPIDLLGLAAHPLDSVHVTRRGAITYRPRLPAGVAGDLVAGSRLALAGWVRLGRHHARADFAGVQADLERLFGQLARACRARGVPATVLLIPSHEQVAAGAPFAMQDSLTPALRRVGLDVCDVRDAFLAAPDKPALFAPDKHFSAAGNRILLNALLRHLGDLPGCPLLVAGGRPR